MPNQLTIVLKALYYFALVYFTYLMARITLQYVPVDFQAAFLNVKQEAIALPHYQYAFFTHVYTSIFVLLLGIPQFSETIRTRWKEAHKYLGKGYVFIVLFAACPSGLVMAFYANGGFYSQISFVLQAILWFYCTYRAYSSIRLADWNMHQRFMLRSYALTLSAISLRLFKWIIVSALHTPPMTTYKTVAWLGWLVNIGVVEVYLFMRKS